MRSSTVPLMRTPSWTRIEPLDVVLALALTVATQAEIWAPGLVGGDASLSHRPLMSVISLGLSIPLMARRALPWAVAGVSFGCETVLGQFPTPPEGLANLVTMLLVSWSLGRYARPPAGYAGILLVAAVSAGVGQDLADNLFVLLVLGAAWLAGVLVGRRTDDLGALELRRLAATRAGAEEERLRIARELHDVVAHRVSMIVVQSQLAETVLAEDPDRARRAIRAVEDAGREALSELRSVLGLLHHDEPARLSPGDTDLARLVELVDETRKGGLPVTFETSGTARPVTPAVALAAYRIVQESLTNARRHAPGAPVEVELGYGEDVLSLRVRDRGPGPSGGEGGHGLVGMRERAAAAGGTLRTGPAEGGGFEVEADLPL